MTRQKLPHRRESENADLPFKGERWHLTWSAPLGEVKEVFLHGPKPGSDMEALSYSIGVVLSYAFQHGAKPEDIRKSVARLDKGEPACIIGATLDALVRHEST